MFIMFLSSVLGSLGNRQACTLPGSNADGKVLFVVCDAATDLCTWSDFCGARDRCALSHLHSGQHLKDDW